VIVFISGVFALPSSGAMTLGISGNGGSPAYQTITTSANANTSPQLVTTAIYVPNFAGKGNFNTTQHIYPVWAVSSGTATCYADNQGGTNFKWEHLFVSVLMAPGADIP